MTPTRRLSLPAARRIAIAAQGLADGTSAAGTRGPGPAKVAGCVRRMGVLQIDSVNVLARSHYLPLFSRLGPYDRGHVSRISERRPRAMLEYWGHMASFVPVETWPLLRWRMEAAHNEAWSGVTRAARENPQVVAQVLNAVREHGPVTSAGLLEILGHSPNTSRDHWGWNWSVTKTVAEWLFFSGEIVCAGRTSAFERIFDLPERVLPPEVVARRVPVGEAMVALVDIAARAHGVATLACLADYFRTKRAPTRAAVEELVAQGRLLPVEVDGWGPAFLHQEARLPRATRARTLLSPFDPLIWERKRTLALFGFHYRIEIYTPAAKRVHGYYVLPFLLDDALVARVDLKADRAAATLVVQAAWAEPDAPAHTATELAHSLRDMAGWLGLDDVQCRPVGSLAGPLSAALG